MTTSADRLERGAMSKIPAPIPVRVEQHIVRVGGLDIPVRDYKPEQLLVTRPLLWVHGGGWNTGHLDSLESNVPARTWASSGRWVRTIDYRLAPKMSPFPFREGPLKVGPNRFPAGLDDVIAVVEDLSDAAGQHIDAGGGSAGANLAAMATLRLKDAGRALPHRLVLAYGAYHGSLPQTSPIYAGLRSPLTRWLFNPEMYARIVANYVGDADPSAARHAFPSGADLHGYPPSLLLHAANDRLYTSGMAFAEELRAAGAQVREIAIPTIHGFLGLSRLRGFKAGIQAAEEWLDSDA